MGRKTWTDENVQQEQWQPKQYTAEQEIEVRTAIDMHINNLCRFLGTHIGWQQERFDKEQRTLIADMLFAIEQGYNIVIEAPTGVGKSIIAMFVGTWKQSYICTSDKMLQDQYANFIAKMLKPTDKHQVVDAQYSNVVCLKGQDNYPCALTGLPFTTCTYQEQGYSFKQIEQKFACFNKCKYLQTRKKAISSQAAVFNYNYWLMQMHIARHAFEPRQITIFDECHKIDDILQNFMDISVGPKYIQDCSKAESFIAGTYTMEEQTAYVDHKEEVFTALKQIIAFASQGSDVISLRAQIEILVNKADSLYDDLQPMLDKLSEKSQMMQLSPFEIAFKNFASKTAQLCFGIQTMLDATENSIGDLIVILHADTNNIAFKCVNDRLLCSKLINTVTQQQVWMSATIGDIDTFAQLNCIEHYKSWSLSSTFNFDKSPIYLCKPLISLSYKNKTENLPKMLSAIKDIMLQHQDENGLIHTSTKQIANYIVDNMHLIDAECAKRLATYNATYEKQELINNMYAGNNQVIVAYSMTEGVSLDDSKCRFQIIAKLSWQSLADLVVKTKADNHPEWYKMKVAQSAIQAIGRGVRHTHDWCVTYILDHSIQRVIGLMKKSTSINERLQDLNAEQQKLNTEFEGDDFFKQYM